MRWFGIFTSLVILISCGSDETLYENRRGFSESAEATAPHQSNDATPVSDSTSESKSGGQKLPQPEDSIQSDSDPVNTELQTRLADWYQWAPTCHNWISKHDCDDGDTTLFAGLLCAAGVSLGCDTVAASQDEQGRFWRSPNRIEQQNSNSFSRDMAMGVLLYLISTNDAERASAWIDWIDRNQQCEVFIGGQCLLRVYKLCLDDTDSRCSISPGLWKLFSLVWDQLELPRHPQMDAWERLDLSVFAEEAKLAPLGYQLHLKAVNAMLLQVSSGAIAEANELTAIVARRQPENPFFQWLDAAPTEWVRDQILTLCPQSPPERSFQWTWERDTQEEAWKDSMLWDCIFMAELLQPS